MTPMAIEKQKIVRESKSENLLLGRQSLEEDREIRKLFTGYFQSKMALVLFLIRSQDRTIEIRQVKSATRFLDDMYRHLSRFAVHKKYRRVFQWMACFLTGLLDETPVRRAKAARLVRLIDDEVVLRCKMTSVDEVR